MALSKIIASRHNRRTTLIPFPGTVDDGSTLSLDFTTGVLDPRLTFTRSTNATFINSQGLVEWAGANMFQNSETPSGSGWDGPNVARSLVTITNPFGEASSIQLQVTTPGSASAILAANLAVGFSYTIRFWVRAATSTRVSLGFLVGSFQQSVVSIVSGDGAISGSPSGATYKTVTGLTTNWTLLQLVVTPSAAGAGALYIYPNTPTQSAGDSVYIWAPQLNIGATANPYNRSVANGYYAPRFDYDPSTLQPRGLLIEASANNLTALSESFAVSGGSNNWNPSGLNGSAVTATTQTNPAGLASSIRLVEDTANSAHTVFTAVSVTSGSQYTFSVFVRGDGTRTLAGLRITLSGAATDYSVIFDLADGTTGTAYTAGTPGTVTTRAVQHPGGWWRISVTMNAPAASTLFYIYNATTKNATAGLPAYTGTNNGIYVWGAQVELGSGASSYIPTGASQGSRAFDSCVMTGTNFSSWFAGATEGVFYAEYEAPRSLGTADYFCLGTVYAAGTFIGMNLANSTRYPQALISPGGGFRVSGGINVAATTPMKHAAKWSGVNNVLVFANGAVGTAHSATSGTPTFTMFSIGSSSTSGTAATGDYLNACVRRVKFWPVALSNAQIQAITT